MSGYIPVFSSIYDGTLYGRWPAAAVFATLLPLADVRGNLDLSLQAIAGRTGWPIDLLSEGIRQLCEPDPHSRSDAEDGRRLVLMDPARPWGWVIVNHAKYREKARKSTYDAARVADGRNAERLREKRSDATRDDPTRPDATRADPPSYSNSNTNTEKNQRESAPKRAPTAQRLPDDFALTPERRAVAEAHTPDPVREFEKFRDHWKAAAGQNARKHDWDAAWRNWCRKAGEFVRPASGPARASDPAAGAARVAWGLVLASKGGVTDPKARAALQRMGGWARVGNSREDQLGFLAREFAQHYAEIAA